VVTVQKGTVVVGPIVSGELKPEREATLRAEVGGSMLEVSALEAQAVKMGAVLGRIETRTLDDSRQSAASTVRSAENQLNVARREAERTEKLASAGALATRDVDAAHNGVAAAEAQRTVNVGDVVSPGTELFTIIDPSSMRLEGSVPSDDLKTLRVGVTVAFTVRGYDTPFQGRIERIAPQADAATRQVPIYVTIPNEGGRLLAGLFAEGRVVSQSADGLVVPVNAVNTVNRAEPWVLRVKDGKSEKVTVTLGLADPRSERVQIVAGLADGDTLLRGAAQGITPGTRVQVNSTK
jgi:membrane fusion protein, multidrug efflux system